MKALGNTIIFTFQEKVRNGKFLIDEKTVSGLYVPSSVEDSGGKARIVDVKFVGPDVKDVKVGDQVVVTPLMWSDEYKFEGTSYWKTNEDQVMAILE